MGRRTLESKAQSPYFRAMTQSLTITAKGQLTLKKDTLAHLGVRPGERVSVELRPDGVVELRPAPRGKISDAFGCLPPYEGPPISIEEMNRIIADAWAGKR